MKYIAGLILCFLLFSCSNSFINHKLEFEKMGDCGAYSKSIKMISNINGERYEFFSCIDDGFDGKQYTIERKGDSVIVSFPKKSQNKVLYKLILDVDAKPAYHHIIIDGRNVTVTRAEK